MKVVNSIVEIPELEGPIALSIGVFDGVHLGHQTILKELQKETKKGGTRVALTFSNHPSTFLHPNTPVPIIIPFEQRLGLLEEAGIDLVIALPFNQIFANQTYESFFKTLHESLPFEHLVVGDDARFGKDRLGGLKELEALNLFHAHFLKKETYQKETISSGTIRSYLEKGNLKKVKKMLGRPYSLRLPFDALNVIREDEVQYKWVTGTEKIALLPSGVYAVDLETAGKKVSAITFYRGSQNINKETSVSLTLIFEKELTPTNEIEITFVSYLHDDLEEQPFSSKANLLQSLNPEFFFS